MRKDLEELLTRVEAQEAKQLSKKDYQRAFELVPESEFIMFAIPSQLKGHRGPLIVTNRHLMFVTGSGDHATIPLADVHGTRYETMGMIKRKPFELYVTAANQELCFALVGASENSVLLFLELLDTAKNDLVSGGAPQQVASPADELAKLADLRDRGVLTDDEFAMQKAQLLGGTANAAT